MSFRLHSRTRLSLQASPRRQKMASLDTYLDQVAQLSDKELATELKLYGQIPGPITDTTRTTYHRLLAKRMAEKAKGELKCHTHMYAHTRVCSQTQARMYTHMPALCLLSEYPGNVFPYCSINPCP